MVPLLFGSDKKCTTELCFRYVIERWKNTQQKYDSIMHLYNKNVFPLCNFHPQLHNENTISLYKFSWSNFGIWIKYTHVGSVINKSSSTNSNTLLYLLVLVFLFFWALAQVSCKKQKIEKTGKETLGRKACFLCWKSWKTLVDKNISMIYYKILLSQEC